TQLLGPGQDLGLARGAGSGQAAPQIQLPADVQGSIVVVADEAQLVTDKLAQGPGHAAPVLSPSGTGESDTGLGKPLPPVQPDPRLGLTGPGQCLGYTGIAYQSGIDERFQQRILELGPPAFGGLKRLDEGRVETIRQVKGQLRLRWGCHAAGPEQ